MTMAETRKIALPKQFGDAHFRAQSYDEKGGTIDVVWTAGATVTRRGPNGYYDEELIVSPNAVRLDRLNAGASFLDSHRDGSLSTILGTVVPGSARIANGNGVAKIKLSTAPGDAESVHKIKEGVVRCISVGYVSHRIEIVERDGDIPIYRVVDWEPYELSAVPVPADPGAHIRSFSSGTPKLHECSATTLSYWSPQATRARMEAAQRRALAGLDWLTSGSS
jgi:hypothetical protein